MQSQATLTNSRGILLSKILRTAAVIGAVIFICLLVYSLYLLTHKEDYLRNSFRMFITIISFLPTLIFLEIIILYEKLYPYRRFSNRILLYLLIVLSYTLIPAIIFTFRYFDLYTKLEISIKIVSTILLLISPMFILRKANIFKPIYEIIYKAWEPTGGSINTQYFDLNLMISSRAKEYLNKETLEIFQSSFTSYSVEADRIAEILNGSDFKKNLTIMSVLDIGGFNGVFTQLLLSKVGVQTVKITAIEPLDYSEVYKTNMSSICTDISFIKKKFEEFLPDKSEEYDLIIASHSLYSYLDQDQSKVKAVLNQILTKLSPNGIAIISFGNSNSSAYVLKSTILELILNEQITDTNSKILFEGLKMQSDFHYRNIIADNFLNLTTLLAEDDLFKKWISYFARIPIINDRYIYSQIKNLTLFYCTRFNEMPEIVKQFLTFEKDDQILLHKTEIFLVSKSKNAIYVA